MRRYFTCAILFFVLAFQISCKKRTTQLQNNPPAPSGPIALSLSGASSLVAGDCSSVYFVYVVDASGNHTGASTATTINLGSTGSTAFYSDASCTQTITSLSIAAGVDTKAFYFKHSSIESITVAVADSQAILTPSSLVVTLTAPVSLSISDGPTYDYGTVYINDTVDKSFTVTNSGTKTATSVGVGSPNLSSPFSFKGGTYPGLGGNCSTSLAASASCSLVVRFSPSVIGNFSDTIRLSYNDTLTTRETTRAVTGQGVNSGNLDISFDGDGKRTLAVGSLEDRAFSVAVQSFDSKIVVAGTSRNTVTGYDFVVARFNTDGSLDTSFGSSGVARTDFFGSIDYAVSVIVQSDRKIVVAGYALNGSSDYDYALARYNSDGSPDTSFGTSGRVTTDFGATNDYITAIAVDSGSDDIIAVGTSGTTTVNFAVARYNLDGSLDTQFGTGGKLTTSIGSSSSYAQGVAIQGNGKFVVAGYAFNTDMDFVVVRYNQNGNLDNSFGTNGVVSAQVGSGSDYGYSVALQTIGSQEKIVVAGTTYNDYTDFAVVRFNSNGTLDSDFNGNGVQTTAFGQRWDDGRALAIDSNGKILVAGYYDNGSNYDFAVLRYTSSGTLDTSFGVGGKITTGIATGSGSLTDRAWGMALQGDGKTVVVGDSYNGTDYDFAIARYWP